MVESHVEIGQTTCFGGFRSTDPAALPAVPSWQRGWPVVRCPQPTQHKSSWNQLEARGSFASQNMARRHPRGGANAILGIVVGALCGLLLGSWSRGVISPCGFLEGCCGRSEPGGVGGGLPRILDPGGSRTSDHLNGEQPSWPGWYGRPQNKPQNLLFIGVMTARKYLDTRVIAAYRTWAKSVPGIVMFFSSEGSELPNHPEIPLIALPGVDDSYPPQKKSFLMLKYMHDKFGTKYEWFMRADDDVYIKGDRLATFLHSINSSHPQFIGQAGLGTKEEFGTLSLDRNENFCMGGPGIVMSRTTLQRISPHISYCLKNLYTTHEDVEVGRCVRKFGDVSCTWAFEVSFIYRPGLSFMF